MDLNFGFIGHKEFARIGAEDMARFAQMTTDKYTEDHTLLVAGISKADDEVNELMTTVMIVFDLYVLTSKVGRFVWKSYRAKDYSCTSSEIKQII